MHNSSTSIGCVVAVDYWVKLFLLIPDNNLNYQWNHSKLYLKIIRYYISNNKTKQGLKISILSGLVYKPKKQDNS